MRLFINWFPKVLALFALSLGLISLTYTPVKAANPLTGEKVSCNDQNSCLRLVAQNTYSILQRVNDLPNYIETAVTFFLNMTSIDNSKSTATLQASFTGIGNRIITSNNTVNRMKNFQNLNASILNINVKNFTSDEGKMSLMGTLPTINDITYSAMLGYPMLQNVPVDLNRYIQNVLATRYEHKIPGLTWTGKNADQKNYQTYYNAIMSIQSFNGYILQKYLTENSNNQMSNAQLKLVSQATKADWFATVGSESIGKVLRQILLFQSQTFVLMNELVKAQKDALTAQTMTNSLLILINQDKERYLAAKAENVPLTP